jgi:hypothetical protein
LLAVRCEIGKDTKSVAGEVLRKKLNEILQWLSPENYTARHETSENEGRRLWKMIFGLEGIQELGKWSRAG